mgnify:CR=1 FL=1
MKKIRLVEIKKIIQKALNEINENDPEWEELELERKPYTANVGDGDPSDLGDLTKDQIESEAIALFEELSEKQPDLKTVCDILNKPELNTGYGKSILSHGNENDKVAISDGTFTIGDAVPTQGEIWFFKSVLFGVSDTKFKTAVASLKDNAKSSPALKVNYADMNGAPHILDGHHRWSGQFAFGEPSHIMAGLNFEFPTNTLQRALSALQVAIASNVKKESPLPSAGATKGGGINCFRSSPNQLAQKLLNNIGNAATEFDGKANGSILSEEWMQMVLSGAESEFKKWVEKAIRQNGVLGESMANIDIEKLRQDLGNEFQGDNKGGGTETLSKEFADMSQIDVLFAAMAEKNGQDIKNCPLRKIICHEIGLRYSKLPGPAEELPPRKYMPQLDGDIGPADKSGETPEASPEAIKDQFEAGNVNWDIEYTLPNEQEEKNETKNESINLRRWNKLAGLLKD